MSLPLDFTRAISLRSISLRVWSPSLRVAGVVVTFSLLIPVSAFAYSARTLIAPTGAAVDDNFGWSVSSAGDVNGDGYEDVIVGAPFNDAGGLTAGRAYVYYGGPGADAVADLTMTGAAAFDNFGLSVSSAGDVNGDGYGDVIVGAYANAAGGSLAGRAYVYYGGPGADAVADLTMTGAAVGDQLGVSVSSAGDVNGDGYGDVIVGAPTNDAGGTDAGRAYVYYGGPGADAVADLTLTHSAAFDQFGRKVSPAGDVNGDGYGDVIVGAPYNDAAGLDAGRAYVYYGGPGADAVADLTLTGVAAGDEFGKSVSSAGDVNGDGRGDVIVGAPSVDVFVSTDIGRAYVYYGGLGADAVADLTLTGSTPGDQFGYSVSAGDVNGDGYADVIVGAPFNDEGAGGNDAGWVYVYYGGPGVDTVPDLGMSGVAASDEFGWSVSSAGDVNGDGYADVIVGAKSNSAGGTNAGRAYVMTSRPYQVLSPNGGEQWVAGTEVVVEWLGIDLANIALSTDGGLTYATFVSGVGGASRNRFAVTAPFSPSAGVKVRVSESGQSVTIANSDASDGVFRIVLPVVPPAAAHRLQRTLVGAAAGDQFGNSASSAGDVNADGYGDVIVGAPNNDAGGTDAGRAYVYYGGPGADAVADLTLTGAAAFDNLGGSVSFAGDVNGDGYGDVIVGAPFGAVDLGRAYVYYGGPGADAVADLTLTGDASGDAFGNSVSSAGDVNGDGYGDVIVGAPANDAGGNDAGRAYVYYGGPGADAVADLTMTGVAMDDTFGISVSSAGDVNGDGFADVIVGAFFNDAGGANAGRAYVYYGGPGADAVADLTLTGAASGDFFGNSVSSAGDLNGDGFADVIVGAPFNNAGGPGAGRAYVFYGGPGTDAVADLTLTGAAVFDNFGTSVSSAGDLNGDGYADVIVGAYANDAGAANAGRAYVYYGGPGVDAVADLTLTGAAASDLFGNSVSSAGDVNGDGYGDVIVGAYQNDATGSNAGAAYLYDLNRYFVLSPNGGETWNVGATKTISWLGPEPADLWLSLDGGKSYSTLKQGVGGSASNSVPVLVPHSPTKFARFKVTPADTKIGGSDESDSTFTIKTSVALLALLAAPVPDRASAAVISWQTDPGPEDLAGYRLEKASGSSDWRTLVSMTKETSYTDEASGAGGARYRLFAVNGLGEELWLGETSLRALKPLAAWPLPYRGGNLSISFATFGGLGGGAGRTEVSIFDVSGRLVRTVAREAYSAGYQSAAWDGRDNRGRQVSAGIYFLSMRSASGDERTLKLAVLR